MANVNLQGSAIRIKFKDQIDKDFGKKNFNMVKKIQKTAENLEKLVGKMN